MARIPPWRSRMHNYQLYLLMSEQHVRLNPVITSTGTPCRTRVAADLSSSPTLHQRCNQPGAVFFSFLLSKYHAGVLERLMCLKRCLAVDMRNRKSIDGTAQIKLQGFNILQIQKKKREKIFLTMPAWPPRTGRPWSAHPSGPAGWTASPRGGPS